MSVYWPTCSSTSQVSDVIYGDRLKGRLTAVLEGNLRPLLQARSPLEESTCIKATLCLRGPSMDVKGPIALHVLSGECVGD